MFNIESPCCANDNPMSTYYKVYSQALSSIFYYKASLCELPKGNPLLFLLPSIRLSGFYSVEQQTCSAIRNPQLVSQNRVSIFLEESLQVKHVTSGSHLQKLSNPESVGPLSLSLIFPSTPRQKHNASCNRCQFNFTKPKPFRTWCYYIKPVIQRPKIPI